LKSQFIEIKYVTNADALKSQFIEIKYVTNADA